jgi:ketosteroid isomerase-like protein
MPAQHKVAGAVEIVRRTYRFIEDVRDDRLGDLDEAFGALVDEGFELHLPPSYPEGVQVFRGRNGLMRWIAKFSETWGEWRFELERFVRAGDRVLVLVRVVARGGLSGVRLERETAHIWTLKDGLVTRCEVYLDRSEGVEALRRV